MWCISDWAYQVTDGLFWALMLLGFCVVVVLASLRLGGIRAYGFGSFVGLTGAVWFAVMGLIDWWFASMFIINGIISLGIMIVSRSE